MDHCRLMGSSWHSLGIQNLLRVSGASTESRPQTMGPYGTGGESQLCGSHLEQAILPFFACFPIQDT